MSPRRTALVALCVFVFAALLYLPSLRNGFVWDDTALIENYDIRTLDAAALKRIFTTNFWEATEAHSGLYRPLTAFSFHTDYQLYGLEPAGYHLTNVLLNALVCALVFLVLVELFARADVALMAAVFFSAFPMHVENVAWVSGRTDLIATLFMLASLGCYARWRRHAGALPVAGVLVGFALALLGKESAVVLPGVVAAANLVALPGQSSATSRWTRWMLVAAMLLVVAGYFVLRRDVLGSALVYFPRFTAGLAHAAALSLSILAHYTYKLVFPLRLDAESDFIPPASFWNPHTLVGVAIVALAVYVVFRWRRHGAMVFALAVIACGLAPVLNILPLNQVLAERFLYFPSLGFALLVALGASVAIKHRRLAVMSVFAAVVTVCAARSVARIADWKDDLTLFEKTVATSGDNARARASLGASLFTRERYREALMEFTRATELNPSYAPGWSGRARAAARLGHEAEALEFIENAIRLDPEDALLFHHRGVIQFQAKQYDAAAESFRRALEIRPRHLHARFNLGLALYQLRDFDGAVREFTALEHKDTDFVNAWFFLAEAESQRDNTDAAIRAASRFLSLHHADDAMTARAQEIAGEKE